MRDRRKFMTKKDSLRKSRDGGKRRLWLRRNFPSDSRGGVVGGAGGVSIQ